MGDLPAAYNAPIRAPPLTPEMADGFMESSSNTCSNPRWPKHLAPPPLSTIPMDVIFFVVASNSGYKIQVTGEPFKSSCSKKLRLQPLCGSPLSDRQGFPLHPMPFIGGVLSTMATQHLPIFNARNAEDPQESLGNVSFEKVFFGDQ